MLNVALRHFLKPSFLLLASVMALAVASQVPAPGRVPSPAALRARCPRRSARERAGCGRWHRQVPEPNAPGTRRSQRATPPPRAQRRLPHERRAEQGWRRAPARAWRGAGRWEPQPPVSSTLVSGNRRSRRAPGASVFYLRFAVPSLEDGGVWGPKGMAKNWRPCFF